MLSSSKGLRTACMSVNREISGAESTATTTTPNLLISAASLNKMENPPVSADELRFVTEVRIMNMPGSNASHRRTIELKLAETCNPTYPRD